MVDFESTSFSSRNTEKENVKTYESFCELTRELRLYKRSKRKSNPEKLLHRKRTIETIIVKVNCTNLYFK